MTIYLCVNPVTFDFPKAVDEHKHRRGLSLILLHYIDLRMDVWAGDAVQLVEFLPSMPEALGLMSSTAQTGYYCVCNPNTAEVKVGSEVKAIPAYVSSLRPDFCFPPTITHDADIHFPFS